MRLLTVVPRTLLCCISVVFMGAISASAQADADKPRYRICITEAAEQAWETKIFSMSDNDAYTQNLDGQFEKYMRKITDGKHGGSCRVAGGYKTPEETLARFKQTIQKINEDIKSRGISITYVDWVPGQK